MELSSDLNINTKPIVYAGFWKRFAATLLDGIILLSLSFILKKIFGVHEENIIFMNNSELTDYFSYQISALVIQWLYSSLLESSNKQATIGKMALNIKVTDLKGERISFGRATGRYFGKFISAIILLIGFLMMIWDDKAQTLHDKMAGTLVIEN